MNTYVLSVIGADRAGLVAALSEAVAKVAGSWEQSHMTELAGMFAGMVLVRVPEDRAEEFQTALAPLRDQGILEVTLRPASADDLGEAAPRMSFEVVGADRPGIVHEISAKLAQLGVGIVDLRTATESAAMAGTPLFRATAVVRLPDGVAAGEVAEALEGLSNDLIVDLTNG